MHSSDRAAMTFVIRDLREKRDAYRKSAKSMAPLFSADARANTMQEALDIIARRFPEMFETPHPSLA